MIAFQKELCPEFPQVVGNRDFAEFKALLERIDEILVHSGIEKKFVTSFPQEKRKTEQQVKRLLQALRTTVLRMLLQLPYRRAARELAATPLYQKFCGLLAIDCVRVPSHSTLERYEKMVPPEMLRALSAHLNLAAAMPVDNCGGHPLGLEEAVNLDTEYIDATALKAPVHHPVDWLLLRDAVRTLTLAIEQARKHGIRNRMPKAPGEYRRAMNRLCIEMTHARRTKDAKKKRKQILRRMKKHLRTVEKLARGHLARLRSRGLARGLRIETALMLEEKFTAILSQVDTVIRQAHERIIGGRRVKNEDKILSLYEPDMHVIVRGKAGAEVEFGNTLFLAEQADGLITDWWLYRDQAPADSRMLPAHLERQKSQHGISLQSTTRDRGFDSAENTRLLAPHIENNLCPRNIQQLHQRLEDKTFRRHQTRRAQTEARIAIITRRFLNNPADKWGITNKERMCAWAILTHNLWVLARLPQQQAAQARAA